MKTSVQIVSLAIMATLVLVSVSGCESRDKDANIAVTPQTTDLVGPGDTVVLVAADPDADLVMPLVWSVSNPSIGGILSASGDSAVYESNGTWGQNTITVLDQSDREGVAVVEQR
jgi:hypothetical protein